MFGQFDQARQRPAKCPSIMENDVTSQVSGCHNCNMATAGNPFIILYNSAGWSDKRVGLKFHTSHFHTFATRTVVAAMRAFTFSFFHYHTFSLSHFLPFTRSPFHTFSLSHFLPFTLLQLGRWCLRWEGVIAMPIMLHFAPPPPCPIPPIVSSFSATLTTKYISQQKIYH